MKQRNQANSSGLFLLELILAILFFSVASAVCVQIFVKSHLLSKDARVLNFAVNEVSGAAESMDSDTVYYDADFAECSKKDAAYQMSVTFSDADSENTVIEMKSLTDKKSIYSLEVTNYQQRRVD